MKFTKVPTTTFQQIQLNAGILLKDFDPSDGSYESTDMLGATTGGVSFSAVPEFIDFGEDIDNVPKNTKELKKLDDYTVTMSGTFVTASTDAAKMMVGAADVSSTKVAPRGDLLQTDFADIWWVGDYSDKNGATNGGFMAIKLIDALSTGGFQIQSGDKAKGQLSFEFTGHYSIEDEDLTPPFEIYIKTGAVEGASSKLASLTITNVTLDNAFRSGNTAYAGTASESSSTVTAVAEDNSASIVIKNGNTTVTNGGSASWSSGSNVLTVTVTKNTSVTKYYVIVNYTA